MWAPGGPPGPAGWDRRRVGARLRAALAGLHELQGLRARQQARVLGALAMQPRSAPAAPRGPRAHEQRLEAALAALQEQLVRSTRRGPGGARGSEHRVQVQGPRGWAFRPAEGRPLGFRLQTSGWRRLEAQGTGAARSLLLPGGQTRMHSCWFEFQGCPDKNAVNRFPLVGAARD